MLLPRGLALVVLVVGLLLTFPWSFPPITSGALRYGATLVLGVLFVLTVFDAGYGMSLKDLLDRMEGGLAAWLEAKFRWLGALDAEKLSEARASELSRSSSGEQAVEGTVARTVGGEATLNT